jgi:uncharacterized protein (TIGR02996 family)
VKNPLLAAIYADPASDEKRAVFADSLVDAGHPLGEFIQLQIGSQRGSKKRAKEIFDGSWWNELHPVARALRGVRLEDVDRGFPVRLWAVNEDILQALKKSAKDPGWSTITKMLDVNDSHAPALASIIANVRMPLLEDIGFAYPPILAALARTDTPVRWLHAIGGTAKLPSLARLTKLETLRWAGRRGDDEGLLDSLAAVDELGVTRTIRELVLMWTLTTSRVRDTLTALERLPANIQRVQLGHETHVAASRDGSLEVVLSAADTPDTAETLSQLPAKRLSSISITFQKDHGFTKQNRAPLAATIRNATKQFKKRKLNLGD